MAMDNHGRFLSHDLQLGGIRTGSLDFPQPLGGQSCRVAFVDTGSGLRFTIALDRGSDIVEAVYNDCPLAYGSPNGLMPPHSTYQSGMQWLRGWPGGLLTTCGPTNIGSPQDGMPYAEGLHGRFSNTPAAVLNINNPAPRAGKTDMSITTRISDTSMFGPCIEIDRTIRCQLGKSEIHIEDVVTNRGNTVVPHHWLYHCNLGYPLLAPTPQSQLVLAGQVEQSWGTLSGVTTVDDVKRIPDCLSEHAGTGGSGLILKPAEHDGRSTLGLINDQCGLGFQIMFPTAVLPRLAVWQHFGANSYVCGIEPFAGSLLHQQDIGRETSLWQLAPGESRNYQLLLSVLTSDQQIADLRMWDKPSHRESPIGSS